MNTITCRVENLFKAISEIESIEFEYDKFYNLNTDIKIKDEYDNFVNIKALVLKKDKLRELKFTDNTSIILADTHKICIDLKTKNCVLVNSLKIGDIIPTIYGRKEILSIQEYEIDDVFDFEIDSESHLYSTSDKLVHHNTAGAGKSRLVLQTLKEDGANYEYFEGGIKNNDALFSVLKKYNGENKIIIFDDADYILSPKCEEITKKILGEGKVRTVTWESNKFKGDGKKNNSVLDFTASVIIITNKPKKKLSPAITSRTVPVEIDVAIPDMIDDIRINLDNIMPEYPMITYEMKKETLDFIEALIKDIDQIDYRIFFECVKMMSSGTPQWKKFIMRYLKSEGF